MFLKIDFTCFLKIQSGLETARDSLQRQIDEEKAKNDLQITVLNENLTTIRGDLVTTQKSLEEATKLNDELRGEKLGMS